MTGQDLLDELRREQLLPFSTVFVMVTGEATYAKVTEAAESALDTSFANEIVSLRWSDYASLLAAALLAAEAEEVAKDVGAAIRRDLTGEKETLAEFDKAMKKWEKRSPQERAEWLLKVGVEHVPVSTVIGALMSAL